MKKLNICIDIDGTITNPFFWLDKAAEYFNKSIKYEEFKEYEFYKVLNIDKNEYEEFYDKYKFKYHSEEILREWAKNIINDLYLTNNVYFVTAREKSLEMTTLLYLNKHNIHFDTLFVLGTHNKLKKAKELNCDVFLEDNLENANNLSKAGYKVLLMDTPYNRKATNSNITRIYDWLDANYEINKMIGKVAKVNFINENAV